MEIQLTYENGNTEVVNVPIFYTMKITKLLYLNTWRPNGIVSKVIKNK